MKYDDELTDYEPLRGPRQSRPLDEHETGALEWSQGAAVADDAGEWPKTVALAEDETAAGVSSFEVPSREAEQAEAGARRKRVRRESFILRRGHTISFIGLFLFTLVVYFRPYELIPALSSLRTIAFWLAVFTLAVFVPTQLSLHGNLTVRPREVNLLFLLCIAALLSIPLAVSPSEAWDAFSGTFIKVALMFIVMVNVVRTERRLRLLLYAALAVSLMLSVNALNDFSQGRLELMGTRIKGGIGGLFENPNDLALHLVTMIPVAVALPLASRGILKKLFYGALVVLMVAAIVVTFSRGGFLGLVAVLAVLAWKFGRRHRLLIFAVGIVGFIVFLALAPGDYFGRIATVFNTGGDTTGSAGQRRDILIRSIIVSLRHPLFGVGMDNFHFHSIRELVSHNAYTQVSSELGIPALVVYTMFIVTPLKRLRQIERETLAGKRPSKFYYLAAGLQASLIGYMVCSFFASVAYLWFVYYLVGYAVCLRFLYETSPEARAVAAKEDEEAREGVRERRGRARALGEGEPTIGYQS